MRYIITLLIILTAAMIEHAYHISNIHINEQATSAQIEQLQQEAQQRDDALRSEIDRIKQEASRSGNRRMMEISYYTPAADENGGYDGTSSGAPLTVGRTIAAGPGIPFGTRIFIPGVGWRVVEDRGSAITDGRIDVLVEDKETAYANGRHMAQVVIER